MKSCLFALLLSAQLMTQVQAQTETQKSNPQQSSFDEVVSVLAGRLEPDPYDDTAMKEWMAYEMGEIPRYQVTVAKFFRLIGFKLENLIAKAADRTLNEHQDYYPRVEKLLHSNGICFTGNWVITENSKYTGLFAHHAKALLIARASTGLSGTRVGEKRAFGLAGKLFPTLDKTQKVTTANFFAMFDLAGNDTESFFDNPLTNNPKLGIPALDQIPLAAAVGKAFKAADGDPAFRPLTKLAHANLRPGEVAVTPKWFRLKATPDMREYSPTRRGMDFREELDLTNYPQGIQFDIAVSDTSNDPYKESHWTTIGALRLNQQYLSYGCDRQLHFPHPKLK